MLHGYNEGIDWWGSKKKELDTKHHWVADTVEMDLYDINEEKGILKTIHSFKNTEEKCCQKMDFRFQNTEEMSCY